MQEECTGQETAASSQKPKLRRKEVFGQGRRIQRLLGYCRYCEIELERNTSNPRKCDGGGLGSILGNYVVMAGVLVMMISVVVSKCGLFDETSTGQNIKLRVRDGGMLLLFIGYLSEKVIFSRQSSCCCRCAKVHRDLSFYCRRFCHFCKRRLESHTTP